MNTTLIFILCVVSGVTLGLLVALTVDTFGKRR